MTNPASIDHANDRHTDGEPKHSALPWMESKTHIGGVCIYSDAQESPIARMEIVWTPKGILPTSKEARRANAALICRAVNCHNDLVEALDACEIQLREYVKWHHKYDGGCSVEMESAHEQAVKALSKAKGGYND